MEVEYRGVNIYIGTILYYLTKIGSTVHFGIFLLTFAFLGFVGQVKCFDLQDQEHNEQYINTLCGNLGLKFRESSESVDMIYYQYFALYNLFASFVVQIPFWIWANYIRPSISEITGMMIDPEISSKDRIEYAIKVAKCSWKRKYFVHLFCEFLAIVLSGLTIFVGFRMRTFHLELKDIGLEDLLPQIFLPSVGICQDFDKQYKCYIPKSHSYATFFGLMDIPYFVFIIPILLCSFFYSLTFSCSRGVRRSWFASQVCCFVDKEDRKILADKGGRPTLFMLKIFSDIMPYEDFIDFVKAYRKQQNLQVDEDLHYSKDINGNRNSIC